MPVLAWAKERLANSERIAGGKVGADQAGWLEDVAYWQAIVTQLSGSELQWTVDNIYMLARRELRRLNNTGRVEIIHGLDTQSVERWGHVVRLCEAVASKSDILRRSLPTEMTEGAEP